MKKLLLVAALSLSFGVSADCTKSGSVTTCYDYKSGNSSTTTNVGNNSYTNSYNTNTGTVWSSSTTRSGNNSYTTGNSSSGATWSSTTTNGVTSTYGTKSNGETYMKTCSGSGATRTCY